MGPRWWAVGMLAIATPARAQDPPAPTESVTPTPPVVPVAAESAPQPSPVTVAAPPTPPRSEWTVDRRGLILLSGFDVVVNNGPITEIGVVYWPIPLASAPRLKLGLLGTLQYQQQVALGGDDVIMWGYFALPMAQYDWRLPIASRFGDFAAAVEGGPGFGQIWAKLPGLPYMPPGWEHVTFYAVRADAAVQLYTHSGLVLSLQPLGVVAPLNHPSAPSPRWTVSTDTAFFFSLGAGYRFR